MRVLELYRPYPLAKVTFRLITYPLQSAPPYEAISYTWGDVTTSHSLSLDGYSLPVTRNAFEALHAVTPFLGSRRVWIDSVCVDQQDPLDKTKQVALMSKIYRKATRTLALLGDSPSARHGVLQLHRLQIPRMDSEKCKEAIEMMKHAVLGGDISPPWAALCELLSHPYWTRVWIVQELAVSSDVWIVYGAHYIPLPIISEAVHVLFCLVNAHNKGEQYQASYGFERATHRIRPAQKLDHRIFNILNIKIISDFRECFHKDQLPELWRAVEVTYPFDATDPRDKIYALCNIARYSTETGLDADYTIPVDEVYTRFAKRYIDSQFQSIFFAAGGCQPRKVSSVPSWVPDFSSSKRLQVPFLGGGQGLQDAYTASGELQHAPISPNSCNEIRLTGVYIDTITHLTTKVIEQSGGEARQSGISLAVHVWHEEAANLAVANTPKDYRCYEESRRQAFVRTLIEDRNSDGSEAQRVYARYYKYWQDFLSLCAAPLTTAVQGPTPTDVAEKKQSAEIFASAVLRAGVRRRFATTRNGYMAMVPEEAKVGDAIWVVLGLARPLVLRPAGTDVSTKDRAYTLVGWCYCHGVMMGEAVEEAEFENFVVR